MNILVTWWSQTGNTLKIAEAIYRSLSCEKVLQPFDDVETLVGYDLIFIGFPIMQFGPPPAAKKFIARAGGKNIALFITHATPSQSNNPAHQALLAKELDKSKSISSHSNLIGIYHCQGELSGKIADELRNSGIPMLMEFAAMRPVTLGHPNAGELMAAAEFAVRIEKQLNSLNNSIYL